MKRLTLRDVVSLLAQEVPLSNCDLAGANLKDAKFYEANLQRANLAEAKVSVAALREAFSLSGAVMPDGSAYEEQDDGLGEDDEAG